MWKIGWLRDGVWGVRWQRNPTSPSLPLSATRTTSPSSITKAGAVPSVAEHRRRDDDLRETTTTTQESFVDFSATFATTVSWEGDLSPRNYMRLRQLISRHHQQLSGDVVRLLPLSRLPGWGSEPAKEISKEKGSSVQHRITPEGRCICGDDKE